MTTPTLKKRIEARQIPDKLMPVMYQTWNDLLFIHWEIEQGELQLKLPDGLYVDTFNGKAYAGVTPFFLTDLRLPGLPAIPGISDFLELNVRTYVYNEDGLPGIWFFSLYANQTLAVKAANLIPLPYKKVEIKAVYTRGYIDYTLLQYNSGTLIDSEYIYKPIGEVHYPESESLDFFLVERYYLFYLDKSGNLKRIRVNHDPYPLQQAEVMKSNSNLILLQGLTHSGRGPVHQVFSTGPGQIKIYAPEKGQDNGKDV